MKLKTETMTSYVVWESDFSKFVAEIYGRPFSYQQMNLLGNDTYEEFDVHEQDHLPEWVNGYAQPQLDEWLAAWANMPEYKDDWHKVMDAERDHHIDLEVLLWDLQRRGELDVGSYLMKIWW